MKTCRLNMLKSTIVLTLLGITVSASACNSSHKSTEEKTVPETQKVGEEPPRKEVKTATIHFKKDKVYEITFFTMNENNQKRLFEDYFPKAYPYFEKYGRKVMGMFTVIESRSPNLQSKTVAIVEWPNYEAKEKLESDEEFKKIAKYRVGGFSFFKSGWFTTDEDKTLEFREDKVYEVAGASFHPTEEAQASLNKYFEVSEPIKRSYGGSYPEFMIQLKPSGSKGSATYTNDMQLIVQWDSVEDNLKLFANEDFKTKAAPLLEKAMMHADFVFTRFNFQ